MKISNLDLTAAFHQGAAGNCASIGLIKAAIEAFGVNNIFSLSKSGDTYIANLRSGFQVSFTEAELERSKVEGHFQRGFPDDPAKEPLYQEIHKYAQLCFAVMVARHKQYYNTPTFEEALQYLKNGANAHYVSTFLGLEHNATQYFKGGDHRPHMFAWQHLPWLKHVVYMSENIYDYYGTVARNTSKFPKRIQILEEVPSGFAQSESQFSQLNYINISRKGTFEDTGDEQTLPGDVDKIFEHIRTNGIEQILLHFHGGLISENRGMKSAKNFYANFQDQEKLLPVSFVWETGFLETLPETIRRLLQTDDLLRELIKRVAKYLANRFGIDLTPDKTSLMASSIENYAGTFYLHEQKLSLFEVHQRLRDFEGISEENVYSKVNEELLNSQEDKELTEEEIARIELSEDQKFINPKLLWHVAKIAGRCILRFLRKRDHGIWPTIIEESCREMKLDDFGTEIWGVMKEQAKAMWHSNAGLMGVKQYAGRYFLDKLKEHLATHELKVNVVGHSAGAVAVCEWLKAMKEDGGYNNMKFEHIIYLAPACRCDLFKESVMKLNYYKKFSMFTMHDGNESRDHLIPVPGLEYLYTRSLLYLISGILEGKKFNDADAYITGLHRHIRKYEPYDNEPLLTEISDFLMQPNAEKCRLVLSPTDSGAPEGRLSSAIHHGGFAQDKLVVSSIKKLLNSTL